MDVLHLHLQVVRGRRRRRSGMAGRPHVVRRRRPTGTHLSRMGHAVLPGRRGHPRSHHLTLRTRWTPLGTIGVHHLTVRASDWLLPMHRWVHVRRRRPSHLLRSVTGLTLLLLLLHVRMLPWVIGHSLLRVPWRWRRVRPCHSGVHLQRVPWWHTRVLRMRVSLLSGVRGLAGARWSHRRTLGTHVRPELLPGLRRQRLLLGHGRHCRGSGGGGRRWNSLRGGRFRRVYSGACWCWRGHRYSR